MSIHIGFSSVRACRPCLDVMTLSLADRVRRVRVGPTPAHAAIAPYAVGAYCIRPDLPHTLCTSSRTASPDDLLPPIRPSLALPLPEVPQQRHKSSGKPARRMPATTCPVPSPPRRRADRRRYPRVDARVGPHDAQARTPGPPDLPSSRLKCSGIGDCSLASRREQRHPVIAAVMSRTPRGRAAVPGGSESLDVAL